MVILVICSNDARSTELIMSHNSPRGPIIDRHDEEGASKRLACHAYSCIPNHISLVLVVRSRSIDNRALNIRIQSCLLRFSPWSTIPNVAPIQPCKKRIVKLKKQNESLAKEENANDHEIKFLQLNHCRTKFDL